jgi:hypothetical protein
MSNLHFYATSALITAVGGILAYFIKRLIDQNDDRYQGLTTELGKTNDKLSDVAESLSHLAGEIAGAERANVKERERVQAREKD